MLDSSRQKHKMKFFKFLLVKQEENKLLLAKNIGILSTISAAHSPAYIPPQGETHDMSGRMSMGSFSWTAAGNRVYILYWTPQENPKSSIYTFTQDNGHPLSPLFVTSLNQEPKLSDIYIWRTRDTQTSIFSGKERFEGVKEWYLVTWFYSHFVPNQIIPPLGQFIPPNSHFVPQISHFVPKVKEKIWKFLVLLAWASSDHLGKLNVGKLLVDFFFEFSEKIL